MCLSPVFIKFNNPDHIRFNRGMYGDPLHVRYKKHTKGNKTYYLKETEFKEYRPSHLFDYDYGNNEKLGFYTDCGKCPQCVAKKVRQFGMRMQHESQYYDEGYYQTLTYQPCDLPVFADPKFVLEPLHSKYLKKDTSNPILKKINRLYSIWNKPEIDEYVKDEIQKSIHLLERVLQHPNRDFSVSTGVLCGSHLSLYHHRVRKFLNRWYGIKEIKFFAVGEYGGQKLRPHFHEILFFKSTVESKNGYYKKYSKRGKPSIMDEYVKKYKRVPPLTESMFKKISFSLWNKCEFQAFDCQKIRSAAASACYISKYMSKMNFADNLANVCIANQFHPMFKRCSLGIGKRWLKDNGFQFTDPVDNIYRPYIEESYIDKNHTRQVKFVWLPKYYKTILDKEFGFKFSTGDYITAKKHVERNNIFKNQKEYLIFLNQNHIINTLKTSRNERE